MSKNVLLKFNKELNTEVCLCGEFYFSKNY